MTMSRIIRSISLLGLGQNYRNLSNGERKAPRAGGRTSACPGLGTGWAGAQGNTIAISDVLRMFLTLVGKAEGGSEFAVRRRPEACPRHQPSTCDLIWAAVRLNLLNLSETRPSESHSPRRFPARSSHSLEPVADSRVSRRQNKIPSAITQTRSSKLAGILIDIASPEKPAYAMTTPGDRRRNPSNNR